MTTETIDVRQEIALGTRRPRRPASETDSFVIPLFLFWICATFYSATAPYAVSLRWAVALVMALVGIRWWLASNARTVGLGQLGVVSLLLLLLSFASATYSRFPEYTLGRACGLAMVFSFCVLGLGHFINRWAAFRLVFKYLVWFAFLSGLILLWTFAAGDAHGYQSGRFQGNQFLKATGVGGLVVTVVPILAWCARHGASVQKHGARVLIVALIGILLLTRARGPLGALLIILPVIVVTLSTARRSALVPIFVTLSLAAGLALSMSDLAYSELRLDSEDVSSGRFERWTTLVHGGLNRPIVGQGFGTSRFDHQPSSFQVSVTGRVLGGGEGLSGPLCPQRTRRIVLRPGHPR